MEKNLYGFQGAMNSLDPVFTIKEQFIEILKCECPPGSKSSEDEDGMLICGSCGGWIQT